MFKSGALHEVTTERYLRRSIVADMPLPDQLSLEPYKKQAVGLVQSHAQAILHCTARNHPALSGQRHPFRAVLTCPCATRHFASTG